MTRSKFSTKTVVLATAIGLSTVAFAGSHPAAAQSYTCAAGLAYDPSYGCTLGGDYGYYGYPYGLYTMAATMNLVTASPMAWVPGGASSITVWVSTTAS